MWLLAALIAPGAQAFALHTAEDGEANHWGHLPITYVVDYDGAPAGMDADSHRAAVTGAVGAWATVPGTDLTFDELDADEATDGAIVWVHDWPYDRDLLGLTSTTTVDGEIVAFLLELNGDAPWGDTEETLGADLQNALAHEFGHVVGLDHVDIEEATMYPSMVAGETTKRDLHPDDEDGARYLYPDGWQQEDTGVGVRLCSAVPASTSAFLVLAPLIVTARRRRR